MVLDMAIDTIFLCFCEDCERNDGTLARPYFMTDKLKKIMKVDNAAMEKELAKQKEDAAGSSKDNTYEMAEKPKNIKS